MDLLPPAAQPDKPIHTQQATTALPRMRRVEDLTPFEPGSELRPKQAKSHVRVCARAGCNATTPRGVLKSSPRRHPLLLCAGCKAVGYCSKECQAVHWLEHKQECIPAAAPACRRSHSPVAVSHTKEQHRTVIHLQERRSKGDWRAGKRMQKEALEVARIVEKSWPQGRSVCVRVLVTAVDCDTQSTINLAWRGAMSIYSNLGCCYQFAGQYDRALALHEQHLKVSKKIGDKAGEGAASGNIGNCLDSLGAYDRSILFHEASLLIAEEVGDRNGEGACCGNLANVLESLGRSGEAMKDRLLVVAKEAGEANMFGDLNKCSFSLGQFAQAVVLPRVDQARVSGGKIDPARAHGGKDGGSGKDGAQTAPRELVLLAGARVAVPGQEIYMGPHPLRPRAILPEVGGGFERAMQPRDVSLILAGAIRTSARGDRANGAPVEDKECVRQRKAQRPRKFEALRLEILDGFKGILKRVENEDKRLWGRLHIRIVRAENLLAADSDGLSDPYVLLFVSNKTKGNQNRKTSRKFKTLNPVWEEDFSFDIWNLKDKIDVKVFDHDEGRQVGRDYLGGKVIPMMDLFTKVNDGKHPGESGFKISETYPLQGIDGKEFVDALFTIKVTGRITLEFSYEAFAKPKPKGEGKNGNNLSLAAGPRNARPFPQKIAALRPTPRGAAPSPSMCLSRIYVDGATKPPVGKKNVARAAAPKVVQAVECSDSVENAVKRAAAVTESISVSTTDCMTKRIDGTTFAFCQEEPEEPVVPISLPPSVEEDDEAEVPCTSGYSSSASLGPAAFDEAPTVEEEEALPDLRETEERLKQEVQDMSGGSGEEEAYEENVEEDANEMRQNASPAQELSIQDVDTNNDGDSAAANDALESARCKLEACDLAGAKAAVDAAMEYYQGAGNEVWDQKKAEIARIKCDVVRLEASISNEAVVMKSRNTPRSACSATPRTAAQLHALLNQGSTSKAIDADQHEMSSRACTPRTPAPKNLTQTQASFPLASPNRSSDHQQGASSPLSSRRLHQSRTTASPGLEEALVVEKETEEERLKREEEAWQRQEAKEKDKENKKDMENKNVYYEVVEIISTEEKERKAEEVAQQRQQEEDARRRHDEEREPKAEEEARQGQ